MMKKELTEQAEAAPVGTEGKAIEASASGSLSFFDPAGSSAANIYLHVPFCSSLCSYCAFAKSLNLGHKKAWLAQAKKEAEERIRILRKQESNFEIRTLYFGGGTPSVLEPAELAELSEPFLPYINEKTEWTIEANPDSLDECRLQVYRKMGINRISIGVQSFHDENLRRMNRRHSAEQARKAVEMAREAGFERISVDLIFALPWQTTGQLEEDLDSLLALDVGHISIYSLQIEENSVFGKQDLQPVSEDLEADQYEFICRRLKEEGYEHYEISSFARNGQYGRHNLAVWNGEDYAGIGFGAVGRDSDGYYTHEQSFEDYLKNGPRIEYDADSDFAFSDLMMGLRTKFGVRIRDWNRKYRMDLEGIAEQVISQFPDALIIENGFLHTTEQGMEILNSVLVSFMEVLEQQEKSGSCSES